MTLVWVILIHAIGALGLILLPFPGWTVVGIAYALLWLGGLGTTVAYHRSLAHRSVSLHPVIEQTLIFFAMFNGSGSPANWVGDHRHHHAMADKPGDISSPRDGFWWAHLRWLWQSSREDTQRFIHDMDRPSYRIWKHLQIPLLALSLFGGLCLAPWLGWTLALAGALWLGALRLIFALHVQCTVNSICHLGELTEDRGSAQNVWWLAPFHMGQGENWHGNHHFRQNSPRLGYGRFQIDVGWSVIRLLSWLGLATKLKSTGAAERAARTTASGPRPNVLVHSGRGARVVGRWMVRVIIWISRPISI